MWLLKSKYGIFLLSPYIIFVIAETIFFYNCTWNDCLVGVATVGFPLSLIATLPWTFTLFGHAKLNSEFFIAVFICTLINLFILYRIGGWVESQKWSNNKTKRQVFVLLLAILIFILIGMSALNLQDKYNNYNNPSTEFIL
jgi:quinol-cytochrome oxidoreductase complex cytochrome b subunit